jgi:plasmid stabilization system protein ParE
MNNLKIRFSKLARQKIIDIYNYIKKDSPKNAKNVRKKI